MFANKNHVNELQQNETTKSGKSDISTQKDSQPSRENHSEETDQKISTIGEPPEK